jgi:tRNA1(Val) A37 N6-methylase TrmN6
MKLRSIEQIIHKKLMNGGGKYGHERMGLLFFPILYLIPYILYYSTPMSIFHFKSFSVRHDRSTMKVGTDAVLLGAWINVDRAKRILDIGTGSGVIAVMIAQRTSDDVLVDAIDYNEEHYAQATENFAASPWSQKLKAHLSSVQLNT